MSAGAELGVTAVEPDELGEREARLYGEDKECPIAQFSKDAGLMRLSSTRPDRRELVYCSGSQRGGPSDGRDLPAPMSSSQWRSLNSQQGSSARTQGASR